MGHTCTPPTLGTGLAVQPCAERYLTNILPSLVQTTDTVSLCLHSVLHTIIVSGHTHAAAMLNTLQLLIFGSSNMCEHKRP
jgi:hypothetical protein